MNTDLQGSLAALRRAALRARQIAASTGTAIVVSRDGVIQHIYPGMDEFWPPGSAKEPGDAKDPVDR